MLIVYGGLKPSIILHGGVEMSGQKLCRNKKTGAIFWWNEFLANDPDIEVIEEKADTDKDKESVEAGADSGTKGKIVIGKKRG